MSSAKANFNITKKSAENKRIKVFIEARRYDNLVCPLLLHFERNLLEDCILTNPLHSPFSGCKSRVGHDKWCPRELSWAYFMHNSCKNRINKYNIFM